MDSNPSLPGLEDFLRSLERVFFAESDVKLVAGKNGENQLILNLRCRLGILDVLYHYRQGTWGYTSPDTCPGGETDHLTVLLQHLQNQNSKTIDLEEINLELDDMLIVIRSIGPNSIALELENIFTALGKHYVHYTQGLAAMPYEIYIPVIETAPTAPVLPGEENPFHKFYDYWAVYYESDTDARIYSLKQRQLLAEDLYYSDSE
ncbi:hypothetical protein [Robiginitalea sp. SC105]|uniref:hypothetical protein n=1 Tax=Robiginitalea sp. SC105 TaxID=2762332 RepID=UPI00163990AB|nr:hypothetical protein [Robiginitalea sp. SC105]MBC2840739.1 hypothetical protein [Robiginitalea sp. SC105]